MNGSIRINKYLADKGLSTRRGADTLIAGGHVYVNGKKAVLGQKVSPDDTVTIRNAKKRAYRYFLYYKPRGVITHSPSESETDIRMQIDHDYGLTGLFPVGRLDKDSEGLIILTDDGRITKRLLDPDSDIEKEYVVKVDKPITDSALTHMERGVQIEDYRTKPARTKRNTRDAFSFTLSITEGKKHQIRRMCAALGYQVVRLTRTKISSLSLTPLKEGGIRELGKRDVEKLLKELGLS